MNVSTRLVRNHQEWIPHGYQSRSVSHLIEHGAAALFLDPGLGKTAIVLEAFRQLKEAGMVNRMLVVAPLRVCQLVWEQEGRKWTQFRDLTFTLLHGPKKSERLREQTDIHLMNPEGVAWFYKEFYGRTDLPYDIVTIDELSKFKNSRAARSKQLRGKLSRVKHRWGLTGSPAANGYMDLFGQMLILDDGAALGRFITYFRDQFFERGYDGFSYKLKADGAARIEERIAPYVLRMSADDYLDLPPLIDNIIPIELSKEARKQYDEMKKEMIISLPEGVVTAANSAAVYTKLAQLANGAVYVNDSTYAEVHTAKLDALEDLVEELAGQQLLVGYEFQHDLARLQERFPNAPTLTGLSHARIVELEAAWNAGEIPLMFAHPASAGHGLNLQGSGAAHICWFSRPWDLDQYDQFIRRLLRQGTTAKRVVNHALVVKNSIDEIKGEALEEKDLTQQRLLSALNAEVIRDEPHTGGDMTLKKLGFQGQATAPGAAADASEKPTPRGWGAPAGAATEAAPAEQAGKTPRGWGAPAGAAPADEQREQINSKLRAPEPEEAEGEDTPPASQRAAEAFGGLLHPLSDNGGTEPAPAGEQREDLTEAGVAASGAPTPRGWGATDARDNTGGSTGVGAGADVLGDAGKAPEKTPAKGRRKAADPAATVPNATPPAQSGSAEALSASNSTPQHSVHISISGLPQHVIALALRAIAEGLQEGPA